MPDMAGAGVGGCIVGRVRRPLVLSRVELFERIRRDRRAEPDVPVRELARRHGVHRRTVREALGSAVPLPRKKPARTRSLVLEPAMGWIDAMLREDLQSPRKQRHTARRVYDRLVVEYGFTMASYSTVCAYVSRRRPEIVAGAREGRAHLEGTVPQVHEPGAEAEVDFADVWVRLAGEPVKCHLFTLRVSYSGKAVHRVYASQCQEAFMQGHAEAFAVLGGVPVHISAMTTSSPRSARCASGGPGSSRSGGSRSGRIMNLFPRVPPAAWFPGCCWQWPELQPAASRYRLTHLWCFFVIPEISSAISGVFPDS